MVANVIVRDCEEWDTYLNCGDEPLRTGSISCETIGIPTSKFHLYDVSHTGCHIPTVN
jgi:hypothetical protein